MNDLIEALTIFKKYMSGDELEHPTMCEHDALIINLDPSKVSDPGDRLRLDELGFHTSEDFAGSYVSFVFGSA